MGWAILLAALYLFGLERIRHRWMLHAAIILWFALHSLLIWMMEKDYDERGRELRRSIPNYIRFLLRQNPLLFMPIILWAGIIFSLLEGCGRARV